MPLKALAEWCLSVKAKRRSASELKIAPVCLFGQGSLKKALEFFAGMVRPGATHRREQKITLSESASLGQPNVFSKTPLTKEILI